jgi:uncharacterized protein YjbI with pentapeptide repeats
VADFFREDLQSSRFEGVDLSGSVFRVVDLSGAQFRGVYMSSVVMRGVELVDCEINGEVANHATGRTAQTDSETGNIQGCGIVEPSALKYYVE